MPRPRGIRLYSNEPPEDGATNRRRCGAGAHRARVAAGDQVTGESTSQHLRSVGIEATITQGEATCTTPNI